MKTPQVDAMPGMTPLGLKPTLPGFAINQNKGFSMTFENGWTVSVQFGAGNYCSNRHRHHADDCSRSREAEIAAWGPAASNKDSATWYKEPGWSDDICGYCSPDYVAAFIAKIALM